MSKGKESKNRRSKAQKTGFKETNLPLDNGYEKPLPSGRRKHKRSKSGPYHIDKHDPHKNPIRHFTDDIVRPQAKKISKKVRDFFK